MPIWDSFISRFKGEPKPRSGKVGERLMEKDSADLFVWTGKFWKKRTSTGIPASAVTVISDAASDAFGRLRISAPIAVFDSKQIHDNEPLFWNELASGAGASSLWSQDTASTVLSVSNLTAGKIIRQTYQRFDYQSAQSQLVSMTGTIEPSPQGGFPGITRSAGFFDEKNGIFFRSVGGENTFVIRSSYTGSPVDTIVAQADWNIDTFDGNGDSGITLNPNTSQIYVMDFQWLGVGRVRVGFNVNGVLLYCHEFLNANNRQGVYMSTPNLPLRFEIENDGTGEAASMENICSSVINEGADPPVGVNHSVSTRERAINANVVGTIYALIGIRLKAANFDSAVEAVFFSLMNQTTDDFEWFVIHNPTIVGGGGLVWTPDPDSTVEWAEGDTVGNPSTTTVTGGQKLASGYIKSSSSAGSFSSNVRTQLRLGATIDGIPDEQWICVMPLNTGADIHGSITWRQYS